MVANYEAIQYSYGSYPVSIPSRMYTIAKIFGCQAKDFNVANTLELGCAQGHNLIALAALYPQATFVGVDAVKSQIEIGQKIINDLKLKNIKLICQDLLQINEEFGKFDYIIANGIFSWVSAEVRTKIFSLAQKNLTPEGLVYISYNVLPGWNFQKTLRDLMLFHTRKTNSEQQKAEQAKKILQLISNKFKGQNNYYATFMRTEANNLLQLTNEKLLLDHLEKINQPVYVYDFVNQATAHGLAYLSDAVIFNNHFRDVVPFSKEEIENILKVGNYLELMQQSDFLLNRQFRRTILCRTEQQISRNVNAAVFTDFYIREPMKIMINEQKAGENITGDNTEQEAVKVFNKVIEILNAQNGGALQYNELWEKIKPIFASAETKNKKTKSKNKGKNKGEDKKTEFLVKAGNGSDLNAQEKIFSNVLMRLYHDGYLDVNAGQEKYITIVSGKPKAAEVVQYYAAHFEFVVNNRHETIKLGPMERFILQNLNGTKTIPEIVAQCLAMLKANKKLFPETIVNENNMAQFCQESLSKFAALAMLVA